MDTGRLPAYRSSYLLRYHPYPRTKPSVRERILASARDHEHYGPPQSDTLHLQSATSFTLIQAALATDVHNELRSKVVQPESAVAKLDMKPPDTFT